MSCIRITARNAGPEPAELHILPTLWFRNRWSWEDGVAKPVIRDASDETGSVVIAEDEKLGAWKLAAGPDPDRAAAVRFCFATTKPTSRKSLAATLQRPTPRMASTTTSSMARRRSIPNDAGRRWPSGIASRSEPERLPRSGSGWRATRRAGRWTSATAFTQTQADRSREADEYYAALRPQGDDRRRSDGDAASLRRNELEPAILSL